RKAREEAERKAREEAERKAREEAERKAREEAERKAREEAERKAREEAERKAREEAERKAREEEKKRLKAEKKAKEEEEKKRRKEERRRKRLEEQKRLEAEKTADEDDENFSIEEVTDDDISEETESDPVGSLIDNIREDAEKAVADIENGDSYTDDNDETEEAVTDDEKDIEATSFGISPVLEKILDENPDEIINERSEKTVSDDENESGSKFKKNFYAVFGVIFAVFACVGFIAVVSKGISMIGGYTSGDNKKNGFESIVYPVVIMDIDSFDNPTELPSDQIITASIWSMIMSENAISNYEMTFDVVKIPAVDVESYAVKLFGENLPALNHTTVGPAESRFYYNEETKSYNVPIAPVTYTYSPEIKGATKNGDTYTIVVNYIDELPEWLPKVSSKSVEFKLTETNDGYTINSMKVLSTTNNSL
ncbi:MAG: hypothetical protein K2K91_03745, partial [Ruminococcus sp.]|nr:hypothetical protein [Ruminococcus sp.]